MRTTNWDIIESFSREKGHGLDTTKSMIDRCDPEYVEWLEEKILEFAFHLVLHLGGDQTSKTKQS